MKTNASYTRLVAELKSLKKMMFTASRQERFIIAMMVDQIDAAMCEIQNKKSYK